jgi:hypothetical protein
MSSTWTGREVWEEGYRSPGDSPFFSFQRDLQAHNNPIENTYEEERKVKPTIPTIKEFLDCNTPAEFQNLEGSNRDETSSSLSLKSNSFWIHPMQCSSLSEAKPSKPPY